MIRLQAVVPKDRSKSLRKKGNSRLGFWAFFFFLVYPFENGKKSIFLQFLWFVKKVPDGEIQLRHWVKTLHAAGRHLTGNHFVLVTNFRLKLVTNTKYNNIIYSFN